LNSTRDRRPSSAAIAWRGDEDEEDDAREKKMKKMMMLKTRSEEGLP
jgi:hypothetical protein